MGTRHKNVMAAFVSRMFRHHFCKTAGRRDALSYTSILDKGSFTLAGSKFCS